MKVSSGILWFSIALLGIAIEVAGQPGSQLPVNSSSCKANCFNQTCEISCSSLGAFCNCVTLPNGKSRAVCNCNKPRLSALTIDELNDGASEASAATSTDLQKTAESKPPAKPTARPETGTCLKGECNGCISAPGCFNRKPGSECVIQGNTMGTCFKIKTCDGDHCCGCQVNGEVFTGDGKVFSLAGELLRTEKPPKGGG